MLVPLINMFGDFFFNDFRFDGLNTFKLIKKFFKKFNIIRSHTTKHTLEDFKYFWIFKKSGRYWKKNFIFYKYYNNENYNNNLKLLLKFSFFNILKIFWKFNKKLKLKRLKRIFKLTKFKYQKKKNFFKKWKFIPLKKIQTFRYDIIVFLIGLIGILNFFFKLFEKIWYLHFFFKNFKKTRIKENTIIKVRKRFQTFYSYKTFEYAYHNYWCDYNYIGVVDFYTELSNFTFQTSLTTEIWVVVHKNFDILKDFLKIIFWRKIKKFARANNRGFFFWERRFGRKKRKFKKLFIAKIMFNNVNFFNPDSFISSFLKLVGNFNSFNFKLSLHDFNLEDFISHLDEWNDFSTFSQLIPSDKLIKLYQNLFFKKMTLSNYNFFFLLPVEVKQLIVKKGILIKDPINHKYLNHYFTNLIGFFSNMKPLFIINTNEFLGNDFVNTCIYYCGEAFIFFKKLNKKFFKQFQLTQFMELLFFSFFKKDLNFFIKFFKFMMENMSLKKHKKIMYAFEFILLKFFIRVFYFTRINGFRFELAGKISVTGNAKTRNKIISYGTYSLTNKSLKINYTQDTVRTTTGVLGIKTYLTY
jgi:hypothetical protein